MVLWLGGTLSAKASQSIALTAARRPAIIQNLSQKVKRMEDFYFHNQIKQTSFNHKTFYKEDFRIRHKSSPIFAPYNVKQTQMMMIQKQYFTLDSIHHNQDA